MAEKEVRKTTAKKTVRRTTTKVVSAKTTVQKTAPAAVRKAPARVQAATPKSRRSLKLLLAGFASFLVVLGISAAIGFSDKGQLNVEGLISTRKQNATPEEKVALETVPTDQAKNNIPNGGLVGMGQPAPIVPPPVHTSTTTPSSTTPTSSTTKATASSTAQ